MGGPNGPTMGKNSNMGSQQQLISNVSMSNVSMASQNTNIYESKKPQNTQQTFNKPETDDLSSVLANRTLGYPFFLFLSQKTNSK